MGHFAPSRKIEKRDSRGSRGKQEIEDERKRECQRRNNRNINILPRSQVQQAHTTTITPNFMNSSIFWSYVYREGLDQVHWLIFDYSFSICKRHKGPFKCFTSYGPLLAK